MRTVVWGIQAIAMLFMLAFLTSCQGFVGSQAQVTVTPAGSGLGTVTSSPAGINCGTTCTATIASIASITLTATPATGYVFSGWSGACSGTGTCTITSTTANASNFAVTARFSATLQSINHIIFLAQENRSFDSYFGALRQYWAQNGIPDQEYNGLPQFDPAGDPNAGPAPTNPGCDPAFPDPPTTNLFCQIDLNSPAITSYHAQSLCEENPSPSWAEAHRSWN